MKKRIIFLISFFGLINCYGQNSERLSTDIDTIGLFKPITLINGLNQQEDTSLELIAQQNLIKGIDEVLPPRITIFDLDVDSEYQEHFWKVLFTIAYDLEHKKREHAEPLISEVIAIMEHLHIDYALALVHKGSSPNAETDRATPKASTEFGKSFYSFSYIYCVIFDREKKNIAFFNKGKFDHSEQCVKKNTDQQLTKIFKKYFKTS